MSAPRVRVRSLRTLHLDHLPAVVENEGPQLRTKLEKRTGEIAGKRGALCLWRGYLCQEARSPVSCVTVLQHITRAVSVSVSCYHTYTSET